MTPETLSAIVETARARWEDIGGFYAGDLISSNNAKFAKTSATKSARVVGLSLWPGRVPGIGTPGLVTCAHASAGCLKSCLNFSGHAAAFPSAILVPRILRTWHWLYNRDDFLSRVLRELSAHKRRAENENEELYFRPNIVSDLSWHTDSGGKLVQRVWEELKVKSYGYTKIPHNLTPGHKSDTTPLREFYRLVFSRSESNESDCSRILQSGGDVSVVFHQVGLFSGRNSALQQLPTAYEINGVRYRVIDGDSHDLRGWKDPANRGKVGRIIGLRLKGNTVERQAAIDSGFSLPVRP